MASPYISPPDFAGTVSFPIAEHDQGDPDLARAANYLYYEILADTNNGGTTYTWPMGGANPNEVHLPLFMSDEPDARALANLLVDGGGAGGTYVNPANTSSPDAVFALNLLEDLI